MFKKVKSQGSHIVEMEASKIGNDFNISIYGGGRPHISEAAVATYDRKEGLATVVGLASLGENESEGIAHRVARHLSAAWKTTVCVTCGIHCDETEMEESLILGQLVDELIDNMKVEFAG